MADESKSERMWQRSHTEVNAQKGENEYEMMFSNQKLTYDTHLEILAAQARRAQNHYDALTTAEREKRAELDKVSLQALQNAVVTSDMLQKQAVRHCDLAIDRQWNKEPAEGTAEATILRQVLSEPANTALQAAIVQAVADAVKKVAEG